MEDHSIVFGIAGVVIAIAVVLLWYIIGLALLDKAPQLLSTAYLIAIAPVMIILAVIIGFIAAAIQG